MWRHSITVWLGLNMEDRPELVTPEEVTEAIAPRKKRTSLGRRVSVLFGASAFIVLLGVVAFGGYVLFQMYSGLLSTGMEFDAGEQIPVIEAEDQSPMTSSGDYTVLDMYFPDKGRFMRERRRVPRVTSVRDIASSVLDEFLAGPRGTLLGPIPKDVHVNGVYYGSDMVLYLDLTDAFRRNFQGSAVDEYLLLKALHRSLMANVYQVSGIRLLIEGQEVDSIGGHLSVRGFLGDAVSAPFREADSG